METKFTINEKMLNEKLAMKYISKKEMVEHCATLFKELQKSGKRYLTLPDDLIDKPKKEIFDTYCNFVEEARACVESANKAPKAVKKPKGIKLPKGTYESYMEAKKTQPETIVLIKCKNGHKAIEGDAEIVGKALGMEVVDGVCTLPFVEGEAESYYIAKLVKMGKRVAEIAPANDPAKQKKRMGSHIDRQKKIEDYTRELQEKEAMAEPDRATRKRIASLKRKIARAQSYLNSHSLL